MITANMNLEFNFNFGNKMVYCIADIYLQDSLDIDPGSIGMLMNPEMTVRTLSIDDVPYKFKEEIIPLLDQEGFYLNLIYLPQPRLSNNEIVIHIEYDGCLDGFESFCPYVHDKISKKFTIIRFESFIYPFLVSTNSPQSFFNNYDKYKVHYKAALELPVEISIHSAFNVVTSKSKDGFVRYSIDTESTVHSIHFVVGPYETHGNDMVELHVFKGRLHGYTQLLSNIKRCIAFYTERFGRVSNSGKLSIIEISDGYGSFAGDGFIYQETAGLTNNDFLQNIYHEIAHTRWTPNAVGRVQRTRFFDEAFAQYLSIRAIRHLEGYEISKHYLNKWLKSAKKQLSNDKITFVTSISDYWRDEIGELSYSKGALFLHLVEKRIGIREMDRFLKNYINGRSDTDHATFENFYLALVNECGSKVDRLFSEWIVGTRSSNEIIIAKDIKDLEMKYI